MCPILNKNTGLYKLIILRSFPGQTPFFLHLGFCKEISTFFKCFHAKFSLNLLLSFQASMVFGEIEIQNERISYSRLNFGFQKIQKKSFAMVSKKTTKLGDCFDQVISNEIFFFSCKFFGLLSIHKLIIYDQLCNEKCSWG